MTNRIRMKRQHGLQGETEVEAAEVLADISPSALHHSIHIKYQDVYSNRVSLARCCHMLTDREFFHLFADFHPGLLQTIDGAAIECRRDLQYSVVVVETAADISHSNPLLYGAGPRAHISVAHYLRCHQITHLDNKDERQKIFKRIMWRIITDRSETKRLKTLK